MAVAGQPGQAIARQSEHAVGVIGERPADDDLVVGVGDDRTDALSAEAEGGSGPPHESLIHRAVCAEPDDVAEDIGGLEKERARRDDFAIGLHGEGIDAEVEVINGGEGWVHRAIGEEPGHGKDNAAIGAHASADEHFPAGHQGQRRDQRTLDERRGKAQVRGPVGAQANQSVEAGAAAAGVVAAGQNFSIRLHGQGASGEAGAAGQAGRIEGRIDETAGVNLGAQTGRKSHTGQHRQQEKAASYVKHEAVIVSEEQ